MKNVLDICTGIGGFSLALKHLVGGFRTVCYVEIDPYCQRIIQQRIKDGYLDDAPIYSDLRTFNGLSWAGFVDCITAGFPCQPFSVAGKQQGEADERNLWPDLWRVICEVRPRYVFLENVPALLGRYASTVFGDLAESGYRVRWDCMPASAVGANHRRDRLWIVADTNEPGLERYWRLVECAGELAPAPSAWWSGEPGLPRLDDGSADFVDRTKTTGATVVPAVVREAWDLLTTKEKK